MTYRLLEKKFTIARQPHRCVWCSTAIQQQDVYLRERSVFDGGLQNFAWHWDCWFHSQETYFKHGEEQFSTDNERPPMPPFRSMEAA